MTALTTEARLAITTSMTGLGYKVYTSTPQVPIPPSIVIMADSPWVVPERLGRKSYRTQWRLVVVVNPRKNSAAQLDAEDASTRSSARSPCTRSSPTSDPRHSSTSARRARSSP